ncbi:iron hydrogenase small subunit [Bacillus massiliigorillae]|uniref:iron hydrogenase small subunit n=1 Tax=Bacillus massiliigorillae TaxID=1243664 RepID=UPI00039B5017|nr:iron hydrogenase small subunit [Bacillus massiliigorillae]
MKVLKETVPFSRRSFIKGSAVLGVSALFGGALLKVGKHFYDKDTTYISQRAAGLYKNDEAMAIRKSHENPEIQKLYKEYLGKPLSHKSEELLHTSYTNRFNQVTKG